MFHFFLSQFVVFSVVFGFVRVKISGKWLKTKKNVDKPITEVTVICLRPATALRTCQRHIFCHQPTYLSLIKLILKSQHFCVYSITNDCIQLQLSTANLVTFDFSCKFDVEKIILFIQFCFWFGFIKESNKLRILCRTYSSATCIAQPSEKVGCLPRGGSVGKLRHMFQLLRLFVRLEIN